MMIAAGVGSAIAVPAPLVMVSVTGRPAAALATSDSVIESAGHGVPTAGAVGNVPHAMETELAVGNDAMNAPPVGDEVTVVAAWLNVALVTEIVTGEAKPAGSVTVQVKVAPGAGVDVEQLLAVPAGNVAPGPVTKAAPPPTAATAVAVPVSAPLNVEI